MQRASAPLRLSLDRPPHSDKADETGAEEKQSTRYRDAPCFVLVDNSGRDSRQKCDQSTHLIKEVRV